MITSFKEFIEIESNKDYYKKLKEFVVSEYEKYTCFPPYKNIFHALTITPLNEVKVVILGQDPYHGPGQAHGLCFSVNDGIQFPPSLQNIFKEITSDLGIPAPKTGNLTRWAEQGVLLLNATLTVRASQAGSHQGKGWEEFTDAVIKTISEKAENVVFILWGSYAIKKKSLINASKHCILTAPHPSPLSSYRGFFGCKHFSQTNTYLTSKGKTPIEW